MEIPRTLKLPDGATLAYRVTRAEARRPGRALVLLHGLASNLTRWSEFVAQSSLAARWDLIRIDLRGHGGSTAPGPLSLEQWAEDIAAMLDREGHPRAVLVGHSLGAQVALVFAARHPERTAGLVLVDPLFREALRGRAAFIARGGPLFRAGAALARRADAVGLGRKSLPPLDLAALDREARKALASAESKEAFVRHYSSPRADLRYFRTAHYLQELAEMFRRTPPPESIRAPVLLLLSRGGTFADPARTQRVAAGFLDAEIVIVDAEHWPLTERPADVRRAIAEWCARRLRA
ncbi:MAG: alpha/beta hydrolase [Burkholderiales bacterium]|jgi:pimeloyl-ACP methyl ester carboxylesterase|nr:alpha/beta hydrolase [Burkholderiales bacterium]